MAELTQDQRIVLFDHAHGRGPHSTVGSALCSLRALMQDAVAGGAGGGERPGKEIERSACARIPSLDDYRDGGYVDFFVARARNSARVEK